MRLPTCVPLAVLCALVAPSQGGTAPAAKPDLVYTGMCEASAAVAVGKDRFLVANDEDNVLRLYQVDKPGEPPVDLPIGLELEELDNGIDLEGAAEVDGTVYWTTSHSRTKKGKIKPDRSHVFGTTLKQANGKISLEITGSSGQLMKDLLAQVPPALGLVDLKVKENEELAPEAKGTNIEGLAAWGKGQLPIGFRNPVPGGKALLIPLENPAEVIKSKSTKARFGKVIQLDLGGLGIRSIERLPGQNAYLLAAGPSGKTGPFRLYRWSPGQAPAEVKADLAKISPEAIVVFADRKEVLLLSDDGDSCPNPPSFRGRWIPRPNP